MQTKQQIIEAYERKKQKELSDKMRALGSTKSDKKRASSRENMKKALAARLAKRLKKPGN
jgi:hypothetical protein